MHLTEYLKFLAALLAIVNPIGAVPIFVNLTTNQTTLERRQTGFQAAVTAGAVLLVSLFGGKAVLRFFGIGIPSFQVAGGILILLMSLAMLHARVSQAKHTEEEARETASRDSVAAVPLGIPLLAGPGAISTVILHAGKHASLFHTLILAGEIVFVTGVIWAAFRAAPAIAELFGRTGINVVTRIMGLIMAAIGVEFIAAGLKALFPILTGLH